MASVIQEEGKGEGLQQQQHHYNDYLQLESSAYSLFVLAIRSPQTKQKYLQRFGYFLNFAQVAMERGTSIEEQCNKLAELAKSDYKWLTNCIFRYLQLLKLGWSQRKSKLLLLGVISSLSNYSASNWILILLGKSLCVECQEKESTQKS